MEIPHFVHTAFLQTDAIGAFAHLHIFKFSNFRIFKLAFSFHVQYIMPAHFWAGFLVTGYQVPVTRCRLPGAGLQL
jgi:hypothetical protein